MAGRFEVEHQDASFCVATAGCLLILLWGRNPEARDIDRLSQIQRRLVAQRGYCVSMSVVPHRISTKVEEGVREASAANLREFANTNLGAAVVVEQGGPRATLVRTLITGIQLVAFSPMKQKVFGDAGEALAWLAARPRLEPVDARYLAALGHPLDALLRARSPMGTGDSQVG